MIYILFMILLTLMNSVISHKFDIWGPGLSPDSIVLPARYFFINVSSQSERSQITPKKLSVKISGKSETGKCGIWQQILNRKDNSFIVRYRLYEECSDFKIEIKYDGKHIGNSPYNFKGPIYNEDCYCPNDNFEKWRESYGCPKEIRQINNDMKSFQNVNMSEILKYMRRQYDNPGGMSYCQYSIVSNQLYRKCYGLHIGFHIFSDAIFLSIMRKVKIPDQSFFINLGDWPLIKKKSKPIPLFSWCGSDETLDIVLPTYDLTESTLENMGRVMLDMLSVQGNIEKSWDDKEPVAFWRGRDSREERLKLVDISRKYPHLYNVSLTNFFFFRDKETTYGPKTKPVSFFKFFNYKYMINIDGSVAAYRFPYLLVGDSVVFKQDSHYYEHFYKEIQPGVHYIPFKRDLSDLTEKIQWAIENDKEAQKISQNGRKFAQENLMPKNIICYYALALNNWSTRIMKPVQIFDGMEKVEEKTSTEQKCNCYKSKHLNDEL